MHNTTSLRDYFAGLAMQSLIKELTEDVTREAIAQDAYSMADSMLEERGSVRDTQSGGYLPDPSSKIEALCLTQRTTNVLRKEGIETIAELLEMTYIDILKLPSCGKKSTKEIESRVAGYGGLRSNRAGVPA